MRVEFYTHLPAYEMEHTECSETSVYKIQTPGNHPKESTQNLRVAAQCQPIRHFTTEVQYVQCSMCSTVCAVQYVQYSMSSTVYAVQYVQCSMCSAVCAVQYVQYSMCSTVCAVQYSRHNHLA